METRILIKKILLAFEQSSTSIKHGDIYTYNDGPNDCKQITVSFGVTEYGNLKNLLRSYCFKNGRYTKDFTPYIGLIGNKALANDKNFINLLKESATDPVMQMCQEQAYDEMYIDPAYAWCDKNKLKLGLSKLVICDSFLQSGSILSSIRNMFPESIKEEKPWVTAYCKARKLWLSNHSRKILHNTVYRMDFMLDRIEKGDWDLVQSPFIANDVKIS